jgi:hypothetical protein
LPAVIFFFKEKFDVIIKLVVTNKKTIVNISVTLLWLLAIVLTLSRTAFIGGIVSLAVMNIERIRKHKKISLGI